MSNPIKTIETPTRVYSIVKNVWGGFSITYRVKNAKTGLPWQASRLPKKRGNAHVLGKRDADFNIHWTGIRGGKLPAAWTNEGAYQDAREFFMTEDDALSAIENK